MHTHYTIIIIIILLLKTHIPSIRMLGLTTVACVAHGPAFGDAEAGVPVVMQDVRCRGSENDLNECRLELAAEGVPVNETCEDGSGAGAVCVRLPRKL